MSGISFKKQSILSIFILLSLFQADFLFSKGKNEIISPSVKTIKFYREGWPLSYPIINLHSDQQLTLTFDETGSRSKNYYYTIVSCDEDWNVSSLMPNEYLQGIAINPLSDYSYSFNTTFDYVHYRLTIPNENISITRSGNYILKIFENFNQDNPIITKKFMINESEATIISHIRNFPQHSGMRSYQEVGFEVLHKGFIIHNPIEEISATIIQNGRKDNIISKLKPQFFSNDAMDFRYPDKILMEGGNEFRHLDIRSTRYLAEKIENIQFIDPFYYVSVSQDQPRDRSSYRYRQDLNGHFYIELSERDRANADVEGDYMFVHFKLKYDLLYPNQKIYINGALTNWDLNKSSEMIYNANLEYYEKSLLLKQGYYNYQYLVKEDGEDQGSLQAIENSFGNTENDYLIIIYYKGINDRNHRIIGAEIINSINR